MQERDGPRWGVTRALYARIRFIYGGHDFRFEMNEGANQGAPGPRPGRWGEVLGETLRAWLSLLCEPTCPGCDLPWADSSDPFCGACSPLIEPAPAALRPPRRTAALFVYAGPLADSIRRMKYAGRSEVARPLGSLLTTAGVHYAGHVDRIVPIPLHPSALARRGFNQSVLIARPLARALGARLDMETLRRIRPTRAQAGLAAEARLSNVRGAFAARRPKRCDRVLVFDDVRTSGATLASAALALRAAGFRDIRTLALATVVP